MDNLENDPEGDQLIAALAFDEETGLPLPPQTGFTAFSGVPSFETPTRTEFPGFPYPTLYPQQNNLMRFLYATLASSKCSIIESPTGTGKSVTLLTGSLHWLLDHNKAVDAHLAKLRGYLQKEDDLSVDGTDWVTAQSRRRALRIQVNKEIEPLEAAQKALVEAAELIKLADGTKVPLKSSHFVRSSADITRENFSSLSEAFDEWDKSGDDSFLPTAGTDSSQTTADSMIVPTKVASRMIQVIYCSRTHSQLAQVVEEFKKLRSLSDQITMVTLASRQHICVNKAVYGLKDQTLIKEACLDLTAKGPGCKFRCWNEVGVLSNYLVGARVSAIKAASRIREALNQINIEELPALACPYYANKRGLPLAQLVLAPYQSVVVPGLRKAMGLCLRNNVLIFDEAHNLLEAVSAAFSATVSHSDLLSTERLLFAFLGHYHSRLSTLSALRLRQLTLVVRFIANLLEGKVARSSGLRAHCEQDPRADNCKSTGEIVYTLGDFLFAAGLDHINLSYLVDYLRSNRCVHKIVGFGKWFDKKRKANRGDKEGESECVKLMGTDLSFSKCLKQMKRPPNRFESFKPPLSNISKTGKNQQETVTTASTLAAVEKAPEDLGSAGSGLFAVLGLLEAMVNSDRSGDDDGRLIVSLRETTASASVTNDCASGYIRFVILNPGRYLHDLVKEARSVILVGGTMKPFDEFINQVFRPAGKVGTDVTLFSCGHVIDAKRQLAIYTPTVSFNNVIWDFTFKNRHNPRLIDECGEFVVEICKVVPGGVVVFFQSFDYLSLVWNRWKATGLLVRLQSAKAVFREPRTAMALVKIMQAYMAAATEVNKRGACIVCVIGGKLSEGINFSDDLARSIIIVGLPYPNVYSAFMREKLSFLERRFGGRESSRHFCEAVCMRTVNQAIGRAIRHVQDYAVVFLVDQRFATNQRLRLLLPSWAQDALMSDTVAFSPPQHDLHRQLHEFFRRNTTSSH